MGLLLALLGGQAVTGAAETQQTPQTASASGIEVFAGTATQVQTPQSISATGAQVFSGMVAQAQGAQDTGSTGKLVFEGTGESAQAVQNSQGLSLHQSPYVPPVRWRPPIAAIPLAADGRAISLQATQACKGDGRVIPAITGKADTASKARQFRAIGSIDNARPINRRLAIAIALAEAA